jgi:hypothetical protein
VRRGSPASQTYRGGAGPNDKNLGGGQGATQLPATVRRRDPDADLRLAELSTTGTARYPSL